MVSNEKQKLAIRKKALLNIVLFASTVLIWGSTWFAITLQLGVVPVEWSLVYRFLVAAVLLFVYARLTGRRLNYNRRDHLFFIALGVLLFSVNYYGTYIGTELLPSGIVAVVFSTMTLMNIINSAVFLRRPLEVPVLIAAMIGLGGIILIFLPEVEHFSLRDDAMLGFWVTLGAAYVASLGNTTVASKQGKSLSVVAMNAWGMTYGTIMLAIFAIATGKPMLFDWSVPYVGSLVYLSVFGTVIAFTAYLTLISRIGPERAGYFAVLFPLVALVISTIFEGYQWTDEAMVGLILVLSGNFVVLRRRQVAKEHHVEVKPAS